MKPLNLLLTIALFTTACGTASVAAQEQPTIIPPTNTSPAPIPQPTTATGCPVTPAIVAEPPDDPNADPFGEGPWVINTANTMWVSPVGWTAGPDGNKVMWIRPAGTQLKITGQRLDGDSTPLEASIPDGYYTDFQVLGLMFPTAGCWQINATAGENSQEFVVEVN